jgi:hypothetical protein
MLAGFHPFDHPALIIDESQQHPVADGRQVAFPGTPLQPAAQSADEPPLFRVHAEKAGLGADNKTGEKSFIRKHAGDFLNQFVRPLGASKRLWFGSLGLLRGGSLPQTGQGFPGEGISLTIEIGLHNSFEDGRCHLGTFSCVF